MAINRLKDPTAWLKVATTLENPQPPPTNSQRSNPNETHQSTNTVYKFWDMKKKEKFIDLTIQIESTDIKFDM